MTRIDKIIFILTLFLSFFVVFLGSNIFGSSQPKSVIIEVNGEIYGKYDLGGEKTSNTLEITTKYGYNKTRIRRVI